MFVTITDESETKKNIQETIHSTYPQSYSTD